MSKKRRKKPTRYVRETTERKLTDFLAQLGVELSQSQMLDHTHKIDALVHTVQPLRGLYHPVGVQITQKKDAAEKIRIFYERGPGGTKGPLLYVEVHGRVTMHMAAALRNAIVSLWLEAPRNKRPIHRLAITQSGAYWWLPPHPRKPAPPKPPQT